MSARASSSPSAVLALALAGCGCSGGAAPAPRAESESEAAPAPAPAALPAPAPPSASSQPIVFRGMCDASGAIPLAGGRFAVADDEDNVLRVYDAHRGGDPIQAIDVSTAIGLRKPTMEADIEAGARLGDRAYWLTSHGRDRKGKLKEARYRFFATSAPDDDGATLAPVGEPYYALLDDLLAAPALAPFDLAAAAALSAKAPGGLNIEGLSPALAGDALLLGLRSPVPDGRALVIPLRNPAALIAGGAVADLGPPLRLDLGGLGIRGFTRWRGGILIVGGGGAEAERGSSRLFAWDGSGETPTPITGVDLSDLNPEALVVWDDGDVLLISDDGAVIRDGVECKRLADSAGKTFRAAWVQPAI